MKRLTAHCPLCGNTSLALKEKAGKLWAYCDQGGLTLEDSHTRFVVADRPDKAEPQKESD
jgi:hypothetical protein